MRRSALIFGGIAAAAASLAFAPASSGVVGFAKVTSPSAGAAMPRLYKSCTNYNRKYPHGVRESGSQRSGQGQHQAGDDVQA